jgi:hypothetical protein
LEAAIATLHDMVILFLLLVLELLLTLNGQNPVRDRK